MAFTFAKLRKVKNNMFDLVAGFIAFSIAMSFISSLLCVAGYLVFAIPGALANEETSTGCGCLGATLGFLISAYPSYLFALEVVARLNS